jgi:periplasmic protein TonB
MFAESMLETSWAQRTRRNWTTLTSFGLQAVVIALLLVLPLWKTVGLPAARTVSTPISVGRVASEPAPQRRNSGASVTQTNILPGRLMQPSRIPPVIRMDVGDPTPQPPIGMAMGLEETGRPSGAQNGLPFAILGGTRPVLAIAPAPAVRAFRPSNLLAGSLVNRVRPDYPYPAKIAHVQGQVVLAAIISKAGTIEDLRVLSGHPMLVAAAIKAVSHWRYRPYILNGEPVEVETQITVNFTLSGN